MKSKDVRLTDRGAREGTAYSVNYKGIWAFRDVWVYWSGKDFVEK